MPRRAWPAAALAPLLALALALSPSLADVVAMSLEERLATAAVVVLGQMQAIAEAPPDARGLVRREGRIRAERVLKGDLAPGAVLTVALPPRGPGGRPTGADLGPPLGAPMLWLPAARGGTLHLDRLDRILPPSAAPQVERILGLAP